MAKPLPASAGHPGSTMVETSFPVKDWLKSPSGGAYQLQLQQTLPGISVAYNAFNNTSVFNLPAIYGSLPNIYSREQALMHAEGVVDKATWLAINLAVMDNVLFNTEKGAADTRTTDSRVKTSYMSAYIAMTNFWFGWNHAASNGSPKSGVSTSARDPIALLRCATYLYLATRNNPEDINSEQADVRSNQDRIRIVFDRLHRINTFMLNMFRLNPSDEVRSPLIESSKFTGLKALAEERDRASKAKEDISLTWSRWVALRDKGNKDVAVGKMKTKMEINQAIQMKEREIAAAQKEMESAQSRIDTYISGTLGALEKAEDTFSIFKANGGIAAVRSNVSQIFSEYALPNVMITALRNELKGKKSDEVNSLLASSISSVTGLVLKWVEQNIIWAWGGIMNRFEQEVVQNSPSGINTLSFDTIFLHTSRAFVKIASAVLSVDQSRFMQSQKMDIAWAANYEGMRIWCKEMWPRAFGYNSTPETLDLPGDSTVLVSDPSLMDGLKQIEDGVVAYGTALRSLIHPEFGATFISMMFEEFPDNGKSAVQFMRSTRGLIKTAWATMDSANVFFACVPHGACIREHSVPKQAAEDMITKQCGDLKRIEYASDLFSYKDELKLPKSAITLSAVVEELTKQLASCESRTQAKDIRARLAECDKQLKEAVRKMGAAEKTSKECASKLASEQAAKAEAERRERECGDALKAAKGASGQVAKLTTKLAAVEKQESECQDKLVKTAAELKQIDVERENARKAREEAATARQEAEALKRAGERCESDKATLDKFMAILGIKTESEAQFIKRELDSVQSSVSRVREANEETARLRESLADTTKNLQGTIAIEKARANGLQDALDKKIGEHADTAKLLEECAKSLEAEQKKTLGLIEDRRVFEEAVTAAKAASKATIDGLTQERDELKASISRLEASLKTAEERGDKLSADFESLKSSGTASEEQKKVFESACSARILKSDAEHTKALTDMDEKYRREAAEEIKSRDKQLEDLKAEHARLLSASEAARADLQKKLDAALADLAALRQQISEVESGSSMAAAAVSAKQKHVEAVDAKLLETEKALQLCKEDVTKLQADIARKDQEISSLQDADKATKDALDAVKAATAAIGVSESAAKAELTRLSELLTRKDDEIARLGLQLKACTDDLAIKVAEVDAARDMASKGVANAEASDLATKALLTAANAEIITLRGRITVLEEDNAKLRNRISELELELGQITSGASIAPTTPLQPGFVGIGITAMPAAVEHMVDTPMGTPLKTTKDKVEALALGTGCGDPSRKAEGCVSSPGTNVRCEVPEQVLRAICDYSTIPVPLDLKDVPLTYSVLDPGSKVRMQLQEALRHYIIAKDLIIRSSNVLLDRSLVPLKKIYEYPEVNGVRMAGMMRVSNVQYARFLDSAAAQACRQVFETLYGTNVASIPAEKLSTIGLEIVPSPEIYYKVVAGPFGQVFRRNAGDFVGPTQLIVNPAFNLGITSRYRLSGDEYIVPGVALNPAGVAEGKRHMVLAVMHLANAAATYIFETAYDERTVMIPGTNKIPAGAFAMLPRADINAVLATTILYPRSLTSSKIPAFTERITLYDKDESGSLGSRICAVGCEVLENYSRETNMGIGELTFEAKTNPSNAGVVMAEAAKRVAEITKMAEGFQ